MDRTRSPGFTLVELVLSISLISILAAVAVPRFFSADTFAERGFFDATLSAIRYAQKLAVASGCPVRVSIAGGYTLNQQATSCKSGAFSKPVINPAGDQPGYSHPAPPNITISIIPGSTFTFDALGTTPSDITITVGTSRQILVVADTGFVYAN